MVADPFKNQIQQIIIGIRNANFHVLRDDPDFWSGSKRLKQPHFYLRPYKQLQNKTKKDDWRVHNLFQLILNYRPHVIMSSAIISLLVTAFQWYVTEESEFCPHMQAVKSASRSGMDVECVKNIHIWLLLDSANSWYQAIYIYIYITWPTLMAKWSYINMPLTGPITILLNKDKCSWVTKLEIYEITTNNSKIGRASCRERV